MQKLEKTYSWLTVHSYDLIGHQDNVNRYLKMAEDLAMPANSVPGFIFCQQMLVGFNSPDTTGRELEKKLLECYSNSTRQPDLTLQTFELPFWGNVHYQDFSLPVFTLIIAALDAFNPCAFFVLFFLLSLLAHTRNRIRIAIIGATFIFFSGLMYFLFMAAWLNLFLFANQLVYLTAAAGLVAMLIGAINIKDYFFFQQGVSLTISDKTKPRLFKRMRAIAQAGHWPAMITATVVLAVAANSYELLCTAGLPMVYTRVLTLNELSDYQYYLYLALYNVIYILPLLLIVAVYTFTLGNKKLSEQEGRLLKLLSGGMMLGLGGMLFFAPDLLNNLLASVSVIVTALLITAIVAYFKRNSSA